MADDDLVVTTTGSPDAPIVTAVGELDHTTCDQLAGAVRAAIAGERGTDLTVDCAGVRFCDSAGLQCLVDARRHVGEAGGRLRLLPSPQIQKLLEITGLTDYFA